MVRDKPAKLMSDGIICLTILIMLKTGIRSPDLARINGHQLNVTKFHALRLLAIFSDEWCPQLLENQKLAERFSKT